MKKSNLALAILFSLSPALSLASFVGQKFNCTGTTDAGLAIRIQVNEETDSIRVNGHRFGMNSLSAGSLSEDVWGRTWYITDVNSLALSYGWVQIDNGRATQVRQGHLHGPVPSVAELPIEVPLTCTPAR